MLWDKTETMSRGTSSAELVFLISQMAHSSLFWNRATIHCRDRPANPVTPRPKCCWYCSKKNVMQFRGWFDRGILGWSMLFLGIESETWVVVHKCYLSVIPSNAHQLLLKNGRLGGRKSAVFKCMDWLIVLISPAHFKGQAKLKTVTPRPWSVITDTSK